MQGKTEGIRAGFGPRAAAFLIDRGLLLLLLGLVRLPAWIAGLAAGPAKNVLFDFTAMDVLCYVLMSVYFVLLTYFTGSTLGKKVLRLHVEKADGSRLRLVDVIYRETVGRYLSGVLYLGYLMVLVDGRKRAFHDWLCDTRVVYDEELMRPKTRGSACAADYTVPGAGAQIPRKPERPAAEAPAPGTSWGYTIPAGSMAMPVEREENEE